MNYATFTVAYQSQDTGERFRLIRRDLSAGLVNARVEVENLRTHERETWTERIFLAHHVVAR